MTQQYINTPRPVFWPPALFTYPALTYAGTSGGLSTILTAFTVDAAGEKTAFIGRVFWEGHPTSAKTMDSTSKIHIRTSTVTFANAASNLRVGLQDVDTVNGPTIRPDGNWDVYYDCTVAAGPLSSSSDNVEVTFTLSTSGTKSVAHGDLIAIVLDLTAVGGADSVTIQTISGAYGYTTNPMTQSYIAAAWAVGSTGTVYIPNVLLEASDGTLGVIMGGGFYSGSGSYAYQASTTNDEHGLIFQVPFACTIESVIASIGNNNSANADFTLRLYSDPTGSPTSLGSIAVLGENLGAFSDDRPNLFAFSTPIALRPNTNYCIAAEATGTSNIELGYITVHSATHRSVNGFANCLHAYRNNGAGGTSPAFSTDNTILPAMAVGICGFDTGQPGASLNIGGMM